MSSSGWKQNCKDEKIGAQGREDRCASHMQKHAHTRQRQNLFVEFLGIELQHTIDILLEIFGQSRLVDDKAFKEHGVTLAKKSVRLSISDAIFLDYALEAFIQFFCLLNDAL